VRDRPCPPESLRRVIAAVVAAIALGAGPAARAEPVSWATAQAAELTRQAREHAGSGDRATANRRYREAIGFDATYGPAYLGLGALQESAGDAREAERAYALGLEHVGDFAEGHVARGRLRRKLRRLGEAIADFEAAAALRPDDLGILRELSGAYVSTRALPAALATSRRIAALAEARRDARAAAEAKVTIGALALLLAEVDPVAAGAAGRGAVRRALALAARRR